MELRERHRYGFALHEALRTRVKTPYVCAIQHDCNFMHCTPMEEFVRTMMDSKEVKMTTTGLLKEEEEAVATMAAKV